MESFIHYRWASMNSLLLSEHKKISDWEKRHSDNVTACSSLRLCGLAIRCWSPERLRILRGVLGSANQVPQRYNLTPDPALISAANMLICAGFIWKIHMKHSKKHSLSSIYNTGGSVGKWTQVRSEDQFPLLLCSRGYKSQMQNDLRTLSTGMWIPYGEGLGQICHCMPGTQ